MPRWTGVRLNSRHKSLVGRMEHVLDRQTHIEDREDNKIGTRRDKVDTSLPSKVCQPGYVHGYSRIVVTRGWMYKRKSVPYRKVLGSFQVTSGCSRTLGVSSKGCESSVRVRNFSS